MLCELLFTIKAVSAILKPSLQLETHSWEVIQNNFKMNKVKMKIFSF